MSQEKLHMHEIRHNGKSIALSQIVDLHVQALIQTGDLPEDATVIRSRINAKEEYVALEFSTGTFMTISWKASGQHLRPTQLDS